jgi:hypothetical protein
VNPLADVTKRPVLASYENYLEAQKAVDTLSDNHFPVQNVAIVGVDVRIVEAVLGRMSWGRAATSGLLSGAWFGLLIGLLIGLFSSTTGSLLPIMVLGLLYGAAFGIVWGLIGYAFTGGRRDFVSRQQLLAQRYDVLCEATVIGDARTILGLGGGTPAGAAATTDMSYGAAATATAAGDVSGDAASGGSSTGSGLDTVDEAAPRADGPSASA